MVQKLKNFNDVAGEIRIPIEYVEKIDRIIGNGMSIYPSRDDFIKNAVQIHLKNANGTKQKVMQGFGSR